MFELALKDIEENRKALVFFFTSVLVFPMLFYFMRGPRADNSGFLGLVFGYVVFGAPMLFGFWMVGQEKVKGTFRLLKLLPMSGMRIILAKSLTGVGLCFVLVNMATVLEPLILRSLGQPISPPGILTLFWLDLTTAFLVAASITLYTLFNHKIAGQVSFLLLFALVLMAVFVEKYLAAMGIDPRILVSRAVDSGIQYWGAVPLVLVMAAMIIFAGRFFERTEWSELEES